MGDNTIGCETWTDEDDAQENKEQNSFSKEEKRTRSTLILRINKYTMKITQNKRPLSKWENLKAENLTELHWATKYYKNKRRSKGGNQKDQQIFKTNQKTITI